MAPDATAVQDNGDATVPQGAPQSGSAVDPAYGESYFAATALDLPAEPRPRLTHDLDVDVCVIGGGLAGLTAAREVARRGWTVILLETRRVAWNASGRNTGFVLPGFGQDMETVVARAGIDHARELWALSQAGVDYVRRQSAGMAGIEPSEGWLHVSKTDRRRELADRAELLRGLGADVEFWPTGLVRGKLKTDSYFQAIHHPTAFNIHPLNYALGLARLAEEAGARLYEETPALGIDPAGVRKRITTPHARVRAAHVVLAGNVHLDGLMPDVARTLIPVRTYVIATRPLGEQLASVVDYPGSVSDTDGADNHYRIVGGDRLLFAGRMTTWEGNARRFGRRLAADLRRRFPQLADVAADYAWTGTLGLTVHRMPQVGEMMPGVWVASGFGGHGLNTTAMAGDLIARAIGEGDDRWRLFQPFELVFAGGRGGRIVTQSRYWLLRKGEALAARRARWNERRAGSAEARHMREEEEIAGRARLRAEQDAAWSAERIERARIEAEQAEMRRIARARIAAEKAEARRIRDEQRAAERAVAARQREETRLERQAEAERKAAERAETKRIKAEQRAAAKAEAARLKAERAEAKRLEAERIAAEKAEAARLAAEQEEAERIEAERRALAQAEADRIEEDRIEAERLEAERAEAARLEADQARKPDDPAPR
jgi:glycine/D-amino acid oxidase-like deaminating enzyme